jgi:hypothetical protein
MILVSQRFLVIQSRVTFAVAQLWIVRPHRMRIVIAALVAVWICGCAYIPPSKDKAQWYATLDSSSGRATLDINSNEWLPLFGADGFGGHRRVMLYFADLDGTGPVYENPVFGESSAPEAKKRYSGSITVDAEHKKVIVDLQECPANGTYPLRHWKDRLTPR